MAWYTLFMSNNNIATPACQRLLWHAPCLQHVTQSLLEHLVSDHTGYNCFCFFLDFQSWNFDQDWTNTGPEYRIEPSLTCTRVGRHGKYKEWFNSSLQSFDRKINFIDPTFWEILVLTPDLLQRAATRWSQVCVSSGNPGQPALNAGVLTTHNTVEPQTEKRR